MTKPSKVRCAVYTRKSSEEGLDQAFNSLHAQREAGEAYIKSQRHEGWTWPAGYFVPAELRLLHSWRSIQMGWHGHKSLRRWRSISQR